MERTSVRELRNRVGQVVKVQGWVHRVRELGRIAFVLLRDRSGIVQVVVDTKETELKGLKVESVIEVIGTVAEANVELGVELHLEGLKIISGVEEDLPFEINGEELKPHLETILDNRVVSLRNPKMNAIFKIQAGLAQSFIKFLKEEGFTQIFTPKIVATGTEGGTELFELEYFERRAYLAQSPSSISR